MQPDPYTHMISLIYSNKLFLCKTARFTVSQGTYLLFGGQCFHSVIWLLYYLDLV